jgi:SAM-dependent methyltransferase
MERAGFLMYLPLLLCEDGDKFNTVLKSSLKIRFNNCLDQLLQDIQIPFDPKCPECSLIRYHRGTVSIPSPRDWGLSSQLAVLLRKKAIRDLVLGELYTEKTLQAKSEALEEALIATFDGFHRFPDIFKFTQGLSFSSFLGLVQKGEILPARLSSLDAAISTLLEEGVTEQNLHTFVAAHISGSNGPHARIDGASIRDLLLEKLQSGEHTSADAISMLAWKKTNDDTIKFYDGKGGEEYIARYGNDPVLILVTALDELFASKNPKELKALDLGCGPGQYAELLQKRGFDVDLYDMSQKMLDCATIRLSRGTTPEPRDYFDIATKCGDAAFDLVFASAMMVHVPLQFAPSFYRQFYRILKPGGVLFVNFKVGDHSRISLGGRFFEYYRDQEQPCSMLEAAGFRIVQVIQRWNHRTLQNTPRKIQWINIYCVKPDSYGPR